MQMTVAISSPILYPAADSELTRLMQQKPQAFQLKDREIGQEEQIFLILWASSNWLVVTSCSTIWEISDLVQSIEEKKFQTHRVMGPERKLSTLKALNCDPEGRHLSDSSCNPGSWHSAWRVMDVEYMIEWRNKFWKSGHRAYVKLLLLVQTKGNSLQRENILATLHRDQNKP